VDNVEEDNPAMHRILHEWLPECDSALVIYDTQAGYRRFLGSDPDNGYGLKDRCEEHVMFDHSFVMSKDMEAYQAAMADVLSQPLEETAKKGNPRAVIRYPNEARYHPQMVDWVAEHVASLIHDEGVPPTEIVILAPLLSDSLRFSLMKRLQSLDVPVRSHRPSRALREEPAARALLTLAKIAHPQWNLPATPFDVTYALTAAISGFDLIRAKLLTEIVYRQNQLHSFEPLLEDVQNRITYELGGRYETLYKWLTAYQEGEAVELDVFFSHLFGEVLSQPKFGFHDDFDAAKTAANLIDSARHFRWTINAIHPEADVGREYIEMVDGGVIADLYIRDWELDSTESVLLAPAYTYLMSNQPVDYQFWLNVGSPTWAQRLYQPLTHPYVLSLQWDEGRVWTDMDEFAANQDALYRLVIGLIRRCRKRVYLGFSELGEQGYEQRGPLLDAIQRMLRRLMQETG
jgi:hypothetical protein